MPESGDSEEDSMEGSFEEGGRARAKYDSKIQKRRGRGKVGGFCILTCPRLFANLDPIFISPTVLPPTLLTVP